MHEYWLQRYIKEHYQQIGFSRIQGPYKNGADFRGNYHHQPLKIEAEWDYSNYIGHNHSREFADILVVATLKAAPDHLKKQLPAIIINLDREEVIQWAVPRQIQKNKEDYHSYPWRRLSRSLLDLYACYLKRNHQSSEFSGSKLALSAYKSQIPMGFRFGAGGKEEGFEGLSEYKALWDYWLIIAHSVANHFKLKPTLLRPTWIDRIALFFNYTGRIRESEIGRFKEVASFIEGLLSQVEPWEP